MKTYGQFCPLAQAAQLLCERWTLIIVREFIAGSTRFNELRKGVPLMSPTLLSNRLKQLEKAGVIRRQQYGNNSRDSRAYELTEAGHELRPVVELLGAWGHRWARSDLNNDDLDAGLLMWDMRRSVDASQFPAHRIVVQFEYPDAPQGARDWWLISEKGEIDLCLNDPGYDVDVLIKSSLAVMTAVWTCQKKFQDAVNAQEIKVLGDTALTKKLPDWLRSSLLSHLGTVKKIPALDWQA
ncbi:MAG: helix-turn-helix transcriptional regulator [Gammaproteobacteria bacterium]|nr:helix-turn-helix transcriptional regulator [Gammaproteobacteria bacterium]MDH5736271.1 helix-turn-helix transcriptional regulator [Gammaproteobacteria bacterium]